MFVTDDETKAALEQWAKDEKLTVSSLCAQVMRELLTDKGYLKPKTLIHSPKKSSDSNHDRKT